jgi:hypothetical protein
LGFEIRVNGDKPADSPISGSFVTIARTWKSGDRVEIALPFYLDSEEFRDNPNRRAFLHGPLVLCAEVHSERPLPAVVTAGGKVFDGSQAVPGKPSTFQVSPDVFRFLGQNEKQPVTLEPFYKMHGDRRYIVYWDQLTLARWQTRLDEYNAALAREKELEARMVDRVNLAERGGERQHGFQGEKTETGAFNDRRWRHATDGGWFSYTLKVLPNRPQELLVTYWGSDAGGREFDILVDGQKLATQKLENNRSGQFYDQTYPLPRELTGDKTSVTVKFQAHPGRTAGGIFGCAILKAKSP